MKSINTLLTAGELSVLLNISEAAVRRLAKTKQLPCLFINRKIRFDFEKLLCRFKQLEGGAA